MSNFSKTIGTFFRSNIEKYSAFVDVLKESDLNTEWTEAVNLYRKGVLALQKNDSSGVEIIQRANESLKKIISAKSNVTDSLKLNLQAFNEAVEDLKDINFIKFNFGSLYESCKEIGFKSLLNEATFYEDEGDGSTDATSEDMGGDTGVMDETIEKTVENTINKIVDEMTQPVVTPSATPAATTSITEPMPIAETPVKKSGYKEGFEAGKAYVEQCASMKETKFGHANTIKEAIKEAINSHLHKETYNHVKKWEEGFKAGALHQEEVHKELYPEEYAKHLQATNQDAE